MQVHISPSVTDGELFVSMLPGPFGVIRFDGHGAAEIVLESDADADRLIRAAQRVKAMRAAAARPHAFRPSAQYAVRCADCGLLKDKGPHTVTVDECIERLRRGES